LAPSPKTGLYLNHHLAVDLKKKVDCGETVNYPVAGEQKWMIPGPAVSGRWKGNGSSNNRPVIHKKSLRPALLEPFGNDEESDDLACNVDANSLKKAKVVKGLFC